METEFGLTGYADKCLNTTTGWNKHWVNDRIFPRRPFFHQPYAAKVDTLLAKMIPEEFDRYKASQRALERAGGGATSVEPKNILVMMSFAFMPTFVRVLL
jgi:hypothetical protein